MTLDLKDFFLESPMQDYEYLGIPFKWILEEIRQKYNLYALVEDDGRVYVEVRKGMYGLKQAAPLAFDELVCTLKPYRYAPFKGYPNIWTHEA